MNALSCLCSKIVLNAVFRGLFCHITFFL